MASKAAQTKQQKQSDSDALNRFKTAWGRATKSASDQTSTYRANKRAYDGYLEPQDPQWVMIKGRDSQLSPSYVYQAVEVLWANIMSRALKAKVLPRSADKQDQADLWQEILQAQQDKDGRDNLLGWWGRQALIQGWSPAKIHFRYEHVQKQRRVFSLGPSGQTVERVVSQDVNEWNQPCFVPILCEDFYPDPSASFWSQVGYAHYRSFQLLEGLKAVVDADGNQIYRNLDQVAETRGATPTAQERHISLDRAGRVEVIEFWTRDRLITVANRTVVIQDEPNPYWHNQLPFVLGTATPDLYSLRGKSIADLLKPLQGMVWALMNQRLDGSRLALMPLWTRLTSSANRSQYVKRDPGLIYDVNQHEELRPLTVDTTWIAPAMSSEQDLRQQMNDLSGNSPYLSGVADENVDPKTATLVQAQGAAAQKRVQMLRKSILANPLQESGQLELELNQQFLRTPDAVRIDTETGLDWVPVTPSLLSGSYDYTVTDEDADLDQQKARDAALQLFNTVMAQVPNLLAIGIKPTDENLEELYEAFGFKNCDRFYTEAPQPGAEQPGDPSGGSGTPGGSPLMPLTAPNGTPSSGPTPNGAPGVNGTPTLTALRRP